MMTLKTSAMLNGKVLSPRPQMMFPDRRFANTPFFSNMNSHDAFVVKFPAGYG
jgi:hypothetical protein